MVMPAAWASIRNSEIPWRSVAAPAVRADTIKRSALSPCNTTAFLPLSANPPALATATVSTWVKS